GGRLRRARPGGSDGAADERFHRRLREHHRATGDRHRDRNPELIELIDDALGERRLVWSRRVARGGGRAVLGRGTLMLAPVIESGDSTKPDPSAVQLAAIEQES